MDVSEDRRESFVRWMGNDINDEPHTAESWDHVLAYLDEQDRAVADAVRFGVKELAPAHGTWWFEDSIHPDDLEECRRSRTTRLFAINYPEGTATS